MEISGPVAAKFNEIHADLEANVTKIYRRRDILVAFDLVAHSVLNFYFQGELVRKGWVEALIVGDTRCGKTESVARMINHYHVGELVTGENATFAGLVGGMQQTQKTWSITWGKFPINDGRLLVVDELSGLKHEDIARMSGVRSSGVAEIIKIQTERTLARVRTLWLTNPRAKRPLAGFNSGVEAIQDVIGQPEDIARFDFAVTVATGEVPLNVINSENHDKVEHVHNTVACNAAVMWAWSRRPDQVRWAPGAERAVLEAATAMSRRYVAPLVEAAEQRIKLARLAVACAARVYSTDETGEMVVVRREHVQFVVDYLDAVYSKPSMAFDIYSKVKIADREMTDVQEIQDKFDMLNADLRSLLADTSFFGVGDIQDFSGLPREQAAELLSFLVRKRAIRKGKFGYYKLPAFIQFLRHFQPGRRHGGDDAQAPF